MLSEPDIGKALGLANPVPDPEHAVTDSEADALFAAISRRREAMVLTDHTTKKHEHSAARRPQGFRRRLVIVVAALMVLAAIPAVAFIIDWETPPLDQEYPAGARGTTVYGADEGVGEFCALAMDFDVAGTPVMAGDCGLLRLEGDEFDVVTAEVAPQYGTVTAVAVGADGTAWIAGPFEPLRSVTGGVATDHALEATDVAVTTDGTVWAVRYDHPPGLSSLWKLEGGVFVEPDNGPFAVDDEELVAASDGSLLMLAWELVDYDPVAEAAAESQLHIGRMLDGVYTQTPLPEGFEGDHLALAEDGTAYAIFPTGRQIERGGYFGDEEWALYRFDGGELSTIIIPFPNPNDVVVPPDGTVWVTSSLYGAFAYDGDEWVRYSTEQGLPDDNATFVEMAPDGSIYIGTDLGVTRISGESD